MCQEFAKSYFFSFFSKSSEAMLREFHLKNHLPWISDFCQTSGLSLVDMWKLNCSPLPLLRVSSARRDASSRRTCSGRTLVGTYLAYAALSGKRTSWKDLIRNPSSEPFDAEHVEISERTKN